MKLKVMYAVREFVGNAYGKQLGSKLRDYKSASRVVKLLKKNNRDVYMSPVKVTSI